jgi:alkaline phosphatase D
MEVHRLFPFIMLWDDHEFANDAWQDHSVDFDERKGDEQNTSRREAATQAWHEYVPVDVNFDRSAGFPNDIQVYRRVQWGALLDLFLVDVRYYRDDHLIPEGPLDLEVGKFLENSPLGSRIFVDKPVFDEREVVARPTLLGTEQLAWVIDEITASQAVWKGLVSPLPMFQLALDLREESVATPFQNHYYFKIDLWDGFRTERQELLDAVAHISGLVVFSGDLHGNYVADVHADYDAPGAPIASEFAVTSVTSATILEQLDRIITSTPLLDNLGVHDVALEFDRIAHASNPHIQYANSDTYGIAIADVTADAIQVTLLEIDDVHDPVYSGVARRIQFNQPLGGELQRLA